MSDKSIIKDLNKKMAIQSYVNLKQYISKLEGSDLDSDKMRSLLLNLPTSIKTNGLLETLLFIKGKCKNIDIGQNEYNYIYSWLVEWLNEIEFIDEDTFIDRIIKMDINDMYMYTTEILKLSNWYKKHAEIMLSLD